MGNLYDELTTGQLSSEIAPFIASGDDVAIAAIMNRKDIVILDNLSVHDIKQYISLIGLRIPIHDSIAQSCREFNIALEDFRESGFDLGNPLILGKITQVLNDLVTEVLIPDFTEQNKLVLLSLGNKKISRADQLGYAVDVFAIRNHLNQGA